jgi:lysozyme
MATAPQTCTINTPNAPAFLKLLRWLENYPDDTDADYKRMFGGSSFSDFSKHPNQQNTRWNKTSTAAGAYMILYNTWNDGVKKGIVADFTPASQDQLAWWLIGRRQALAAVCGGRNMLDVAFALLRPEWSSLPGASQNLVSVQAAKSRYETYLLQATQPMPPGATP